MDDVESLRPVRPAQLLRLLPTATVLGCVWTLAWETNGSIDAPDWLPYALLCGIVVAIILLSGAGVRPDGLTTAAVGLLACFGAWTAISIAWTPLPSLARDDSLLIFFYVLAFVMPLVTLRSAADRLAATALVVAGLSSLSVVTIFAVRFDSPATTYLAGRLDFPITYWNAAAAIALVGVWPAIALAAGRSLHPLLRALALAGATAMLVCWLLTQSKGGGVALAVSAIAFFVVVPRRLRALVPALLAAAIAGSGATALTAPYRASQTAFAGSVRHAASIGLLLTGIGLVGGLAYALVDRRMQLPARVNRAAGALVVTVVAAACLGGIAAFFVTEDHPVRFAQQKWDSFKHLSTNESATSHFTSLGSNRYDFWRVALDEFAHHPIAGIGGHGWPAAYLKKGRSSETPERAHSVELDALAETGAVGFLLLVAGGALGLTSVGRRARWSPMAAGLFASGVYFAVHASGDWVWTTPPVGLAAFLILGIGATPLEASSLRGVVAVPAAVLVAAVAVVGFAPPWLSARLTDEAYSARTIKAQADDLSWARWLDPLSVDPLLAQAALATPPADIPPLRRAVGKQPGDSEVHYVLGLAYLDLKRFSEARRELRIALSLSPRDPDIRAALDRAH